MPAKQRTAMWVPAYADLPDHPKTSVLRRRLGLSKDAACMRLFRLWWWAMTYAPDGDVTGFDPFVIADAAEFEGDAATFVEVLLEAGWLARDGDRLLIHEWEDYGGKVERRRKQNADAQARFRGRSPEPDPSITTASPNDDVSITSDVGERVASLSRSSSSSRPATNDENDLSPRGRANREPLRKLPTSGVPPATPGARERPTPLRPSHRTPRVTSDHPDDERPIEERRPPWAEGDPPGDAGEELLAATRHRRALFDAYADELKLAPGSTERRQRQTRAATLLADPAASDLTVERVRALTRYTAARRRQTGYVPTPDLEHVLGEASAHDAWLAAGGLTDQAGGPVLPRAPARASPRPAATSTAEDGGLAEWRRAQDAERSGVAATPGSG